MIMIIYDWVWLNLKVNCVNLLYSVIDDDVNVTGYIMMK